MKYDLTNPCDLKAIHLLSSRHRAAVERSAVCGCFHCLAVFSPVDLHGDLWIEEWRGGQTATCPFCRIDSVLPGSKVDITVDMLETMQRRYFAPAARIRREARVG